MHITVPTPKTEILHRKNLTKYKYRYYVYTSKHKKL